MKIRQVILALGALVIAAPVQATNVVTVEEPAAGALLAAAGIVGIIALVRRRR